MTPAPDADGWIEWSGGECPVPEDQDVSVRIRDLGESGLSKAGWWNWERGTWEDRGDIIAYRIVEPRP